MAKAKFKSDRSKKPTEIDVQPTTIGGFDKYEPKMEGRFIVYINDIPTYLIKAIDIPSYYYSWGCKRYNPLTVTLYDPIHPSAAKAVENKFKNGRKCDITIVVLGPVGDKVEEWQIKNAKLQAVTFSSYDWSGDNPSMVYLTFSVRDVTLMDKPTPPELVP